jgi:hypothetical protein
MTTEPLHSLSNHFLDLRLVSLRSWRLAREVVPRDDGGPYMVVQAGYDPEDLRMQPDEFVLGRAGKWMPVGVMLRLPAELRRREFVFGMASEVMQLIDGLPRKAVVWSAREGGAEVAGEVVADELTEAFLVAKQGLD